MERLLAAISATVDPASLIQKVAQQASLFTPVADGAAVSIYAPSDQFIVVSAHGVVHSLLGLTLPSAGTFQGLAARTRQPQVTDDGSNDERLTPQVRAIGRRLGIRSMAVIPLHRGDVVIGALTFTATEAARFTPADVAGMVAIGRLVSVLISSHEELSAILAEIGTDEHHHRSTTHFLASMLLPDVLHSTEKHQQLDDLLAAPEQVKTVYQPIVDLDSREIIAYEALSRFPAAPHLTTPQWFETASTLGRGSEMERITLQAALRAASTVPHQYGLAVNVSPSAIADDAIRDLILGADRSLHLEVTEHEPFPPGLADDLAQLRAGGALLVIDDVGAGYAGLREVIRLRPDIIKIDGELVHGVEDDPLKRALITAIVSLARELGAVTVAEAIETQTQLDFVTNLGVQRGQGYLLGRPQ